MKANILKNWHKSNNKYNWEQGCESCKGKFEDEEKFVRVDVQTSFMRGDDDVFCFHEKCFNSGYEDLKNNYL